jgi:hypothetical protein
MRSTDRGLSWDNICPTTCYHGLKVQVHPETQAIYYLEEGLGLWESTDFGISWVDKFTDFEHSFAFDLLIDQDHPNRFFGGEAMSGARTGGVYISGDEGTTFSFMGLRGDAISSLTLNGSSTKLFAVSLDGIYVVDVVPGDFDLDGDVDGSDFLLWQRNPSVGSLADWKAHYATTANGSTTTIIPEPTTHALALAVLCLVGSRLANVRRHIVRSRLRQVG